MLANPLAREGSDMAKQHGWNHTSAGVKSAPVGRHMDKYRHGLMLVVQPSGSRSWIQRLIIQGKRRDMGLGGYPLVTLAEARDKAIENRRVARAGGDPRCQSTAVKVPTFADATRPSMRSTLQAGDPRSKASNGSMK